METGEAMRSPALPYGWYPRDRESIALALNAWTDGLEAIGARAVVCPHAGWTFSGRLAAMAIASLKAVDTVVVIGGHLAPGSPILCAREKAFGTAAGEIRADAALLKALGDELLEAGIPHPAPDLEADNSVEVLLPMVAILHPGAEILWLRSPPRSAAKELGAAIGRASIALGKNVACVGSTDLTHYGPAYGFTPAGLGEKAEKWVKGTNDKAFIDALLDMNGDAVLALAAKKGSACSAGAAAAAIGFALETGSTEARLLAYSTSLEVRRDDSFVGYAAVAFL